MKKKRLVAKIRKKKLMFKWPAGIETKEIKVFITKLEDVLKRLDWVEPGTVLILEKQKLSMRISTLPIAKELKQFKKLVKHVSEIHSELFNKPPRFVFPEKLETEPDEDEEELPTEEDTMPFYLQRGPKGGLCRLPASEGKNIGVKGVCARFKEGNSRHKTIAELRAALQVVDDDFDLKKLLEVAEEC